MSSQYPGGYVTSNTPPYESNSVYFRGSWDSYAVPQMYPTAASTNFSLYGSSGTVEGWFYVSAYPPIGGNPYYGGSVLFSFENGAPLYYAMNIGMDGSLFLQKDGNGVVSSASTVQIPLKTWTHICWERTSGGSNVFYVNGVDITSTFGNPTLSGNFPLNITPYLTLGGNPYNLNSIGWITPFVGYISNFRIVKGSQVYGGAFTPPKAPLTNVSGTQLLLCQASTLVDSGPNALAVTTNFTPQVSSKNPYVDLYKAPTSFDPALGGAAPGMWTLSEATAFTQDKTWPIYDPYYENVVLNLHGEGANAAQNNTFLDSSTNNFAITRNGNVTQGTFSPYGNEWSNYFDGSGDYLSFAASANLQPGSSDFCVEAWVFPTVVDSTGRYIYSANDNSSGTNLEFRISHSSSGVFCNYYATGGYLSQISTSTPLVVSTWSHVAWTRSGSTISLFVNGVRVATGSISGGSSASTAYAYVGEFISSSGYQFTGNISNLRFVKGSYVYDPGLSTLTPPTSPLTAITNTKLLTCQSNRFVDSSASPLTLTVNGNPSVKRFSPFSPAKSYDVATIGGSGYFDGSGDYLSIADQTALHLGASDFSIECWTYLNTTTGAQRPISQKDTNYEFAFYIANGGAVTAYSFQSNGTQNFGISGGTLVTGQWYHLACTRTGSTVAFFVNGVRQNTASFAGTVSTSTTGWNLGASGSGTDVQSGYITDARIVIGSNPYGVGTTLTLPTAPVTAITNTQLLCKMTNAGIIDNAMMNTLETVGNAQVSTSAKKYGTGSMYFDGSGDGLFQPANNNFTFGTDDFTIECWVNLASATQSYPQIFNISTGDTNSGIPLSIAFGDSGTGYKLNAKINGSDNNLAYPTQSNFLNTWGHIAVSRSGNMTRVFFNGGLLTTVQDVGNYSGSYRLRIGYLTNEYGSFYLNGYVDDLRVTKGVARYTSSFTPPTSQLQDQ